MISHPLSTVQCNDIPPQLDILNPPLFLLSQTKANPKNNYTNQIEVKNKENNASDRICQVKNFEDSSTIHELANPFDLVSCLNDYISTNQCRDLVNPIPEIQFFF